MSILPESLINIPIDAEIVYENYPTYTFYVNPITKKIEGMCDGIIAMAQTMESIVSVERYQYSILEDNIGMETLGLVGQDYGYVVSDYKRRLLEAISVDDRFIGMARYDFSEQINDSVEIQTDIVTVYGNYTSRIVLDVR